MRVKRNRYTAELKAKVALEALRNDLTLNEIATKYQTHASQINRWKQQAMLAIKAGFTGKQDNLNQSEQQLIDDLYRQIGQLSCENSFLKKSAWK